MKRLFIFAAVLLGVIICNDGLAQSNSSPYTATYSSSFKMGKAAYASKILDLWKDWMITTLTGMIILQTRSACGLQLVHLQKEKRPIWRLPKSTEIQ